MNKEEYYIVRVKKYINRLQKISKKTHHTTMEDAADRLYIKAYIESCMSYIKDNSLILEFDGGVVYAPAIIKEKGGEVEYATKKGRLEKYNIITHEFDIKSEIIEKEFDLIIATQMLSSFVNPIDIMKKLKKMLKPGGILIVTTSGPAYPKVKGQIAFYSKEGLVEIGRSVFGVKNVKNVMSYGDFFSSICMLNYLSNKIYLGEEDVFDYKHEVINGILCTNEIKK
ncbi:MAG: methyltransferase domain-containing protein [Clostridia bacterium]|nr:methyltransferase domain-containing protein [Clostridia bacterium]